jgi:hypothetical protein
LLEQEEGEADHEWLEVEVQRSGEFEDKHRC